MQWSDTGIILSSHKYGENSLILKVFTPSRGVHAGLVRSSKKTKVIYQAGNLVDVSWSARLEEHLGSFKCELKSAISGLIMTDSKKLLGLQSSCIMIEQTMMERDPHPALYYEFENFLLRLKGNESWQSHYILFEIELLKNLGFGLDLERCAATGVVDNLAYISPKTGRAVSEIAGEPYKDRLFKYPKFVSSDYSALPPDITDGLSLTSHFFNEFFFKPNNKKLPSSRDRLAKTLAS